MLTLTDPYHRAEMRSRFVTDGNAMLGCNRRWTHACCKQVTQIVHWSAVMQTTAATLQCAVDHKNSKNMKSSELLLNIYECNVAAYFKAI